MNIVKIISEPAILIICTAFILFVLIVLQNYLRVNKNLSSIYKFLASFSKKELSYRFKELNEFMESSIYTQTIWDDFKKALIYPDKIYNNNGTSDICLTIDASYFFNEDSLILSKINYKFIQTIPTILTGLGPFFTFLKMAIAFSAVNLTINSEIGNSLNDLIANIQIAALCSVFAVGFSLLFMLTEKILYNKMCKSRCFMIQKEFIRIFDVVTSEKFLTDLVSESKSTNIKNLQILEKLPENLGKEISESLNKTTVPYMENILYSLNKLNATLSKNNGDDIIDKLF